MLSGDRINGSFLSLLSLSSERSVSLLVLLSSGGLNVDCTLFLAAGYGAISQYFLTNPDPIRAVNLGTAMFAVSLTTNVVVTGLTVGRIW